MLMPSLFTRDLFDDFFEPRYSSFDRNQNVMKTDVKETATGYELSMELPGVKREDLKADLKDGYLNISAVINQDKEEKNAEGRYLRRERYTGSFSRSFYVGEDITQEDIKAKFQDGILKLQVPKKDQLPKTEEKKYITIEG